MWMFAFVLALWHNTEIIFSFFFFNYIQIVLTWAFGSCFGLFSLILVINWETNHGVNIGNSHIFYEKSIMAESLDYIKT